MEALIVYEVFATPAAVRRRSASKSGSLDHGDALAATDWPGTRVLELLADRFVEHQPFRGWLDLATGCQVQLRVAPAGDREAQIVWNDRCGELARLRHPLLNALIDFGGFNGDRTFEAYLANNQNQSSASANGRTLEHARAFLESRNVQLTREMAPFVVRDATAPGTGSTRRGVGVVLQPRAAVMSMVEAIAATGSGTATITVAGGSRCGLSTARMHAARAARLAGYVPIAPAMLRQFGSDLRSVLGDRHVCLLVDSSRNATEEPAASLVAQLAVSSARRHVIVRFVRSEARVPGVIELESMPVNALLGMLYLNRRTRLTDATLRAAARDSGGRPGVFLDRINARSRDLAYARLSVARESSPAYIVPAPTTLGVRRRRLGRVLADAPERAARLARSGRHAPAIRLLTRASRVLEGRGDTQLAAACAEQLGWIERERGRSARALAAFERARALGTKDVAVGAAIGIGVTWTDDRRFTEAEAALRGACAAADLLCHSRLAHRARRALARCLHWQDRSSEAVAVMSAPTHHRGDDVDVVETAALRSKLALKLGDLRQAVALATTATSVAERAGDLRVATIASHCMVLAQSAVGNHDQAIVWAERGVRAAGQAHLPVRGLRLRALAFQASLQASGETSTAAAPPSRPYINHMRSALRVASLPALVRAELESACAERARAIVPVDVALAAQDRTLKDLEAMLALVHGAGAEDEGLDALCAALLDSTRAATVQILTGSPSPRTLARAGRPWQSELSDIDRVIIGGTSQPVGDVEPKRAAEPIRYGRDVIAAMFLRWTAGVDVDRATASAKLRAAALAAAAAVRTLLDRSEPIASGAVNTELIGTSPVAAALREAMARAARAPFPVLIEGESGSGKELVARGIHRLGPRRDRRLCTVNCAALTDDLLEAELFGHARGAFTGAIGERAGLFEEADGGTLFLDEIGELSPRAQAKLLRVLQDGEVRRVGENLPRRVDARIIAASNRRLDEEAAAGRFRADLRFRLDVVRITVPPLRDRSTDIPALALHFWAEASSRVGSAATLPPETLAALSRYDWPGNVRELQNAIASLAVHAPRRGRILPSVLPAHIARAAQAAATSFDAARQEFERRYVRAALAHAGGHRSRAARALGVSRQGLAKMLRRLRIEG